ncbi:uncharacterized protein LOC112637804 [Camponotus floridanus]|uniref:uncharacterized protein LOC112637804 n=1 Tax=Camponotus floridanus TaxID=104421 RepID=UPI000DC66A45|nr:uncharacterized protein LOC112637804 [Camponotus floridanus]
MFLSFNGTQENALSGNLWQPRRIGQEDAAGIPFVSSGKSIEKKEMCRPVICSSSSEKTNYSHNQEKSLDVLQSIVEDPHYTLRKAAQEHGLDGTLNRHNCRYWDNENPHWKRENNTQYPEKLNVWAGILNDQIIGPFLIEGNLNSEQYEDMLRNEIVPRIMEITGQNFEHTYFQQDGAPPHYGRNVRNYLDVVFNDRWIGRRGYIEWPARSPDLSPLDYFLWGYLKDRMYKNKPQNLQELRQRILDECAIILADNESCLNWLESNKSCLSWLDDQKSCLTWLDSNEYCLNWLEDNKSCFN